MSFQEEFEVVDLILDSNFKARTVDAFCLSLIKAERQLRRLFTYIAYQSPAFNKNHITELRNSLAENRHVYFEGVESGFNLISTLSIENLVGIEYTQLKSQLIKATKYRNKIFHGQLTSENLSRNDLLLLTNNIKLWCKYLADAADQHIDYDGFKRNSFRKSNLINVDAILKIKFSSVDEYNNFIATTMDRRR